MTKAIRIESVTDRRALLLAAAALFMTAATALGQQRPITLGEALDLARQNNPLYLSTKNDEAPADWAVRQSTSDLFLPQASLFASATRRSPGVQRVGTINTGAADQGALFTSFWQFQLSYSLDGTTWFGRSSARADRDAAHARTRAAEFNMESSVTLQFMTALRARDQLEVANRQLIRSQENLEIAQARVQAEAAIITDEKQAEVQRGRDQVSVLQAESALRVETLRLMEQMGISLDEEIDLVNEFELFTPDWTSEELISWALETHPQLRAFVAAEKARVADVRQARSSYFPTVQLTGTWSGFTQKVENGAFLVGQARDGIDASFQSCNFLNDVASRLTSPIPGFVPQNCGTGLLSAEGEQAILAGNNAFPFNFESIPFQAGLSVSLPLFTGFNRERQVSQSAAAREDAAYARRGEELRLRTAVTSALDGLETAYDVVQIEERNREVAAEQLTLSRQRYQLGADNFLLLLDAERTMADAERSYLDALYTFHVQIAGLELAVGRRLRPGGAEAGN